MSQGDSVKYWDEAFTPCSPQAHERAVMVEQEHVPAGMQELCRQPTGDPQKPSTQGESPRMPMGKPCPGACPELEQHQGQLWAGVGGGRGQLAVSQWCR